MSGTMAGVRAVAIYLCMISMLAASEPISVVDSFQQRIAKVSSFSASIERLQTYRDARRIGRGTVVFDRAQGCRYKYHDPGRYCFISNNTMVCGIDLGKMIGWRKRTAVDPVHPALELRERIDPLYRFLQVASVDIKTLTYRGNSAELLFFAVALGGGKQRTIGFDAALFQCRIMETFDSTGKIIEKTIFSYGKKLESPVPSLIIVSEPAGDCIAVDSIVFKRIRVNGAVPPDAFAIPNGVRWRDEGTLTPFDR